MREQKSADDGDPRRPRSGEVLGGRYFLLERLGAGGMGEVWRAENVATGAEVAIKVLAAQSHTPDGIARFRREAVATARLAHRSIVRVFDLVELPDAGSLAMIMERLRGKTLSDRLRCEGPLSIEAALGTLVPILSALHYVHGLGIVHRDLKPENVFLHVEPDGEVVPKLLDFGVSKMLRSSAPPITLVGRIVGTPMYMSPEQLEGAPVDARSDVFGAGVLLYTCLTGRSPFLFDGRYDLSCRPSELKSERPSTISPELWAVILKALERSPHRRYASALELGAALIRATPKATLARATRRSELPSAESSSSWVVPPRAAQRGVASAALVACIVGLACAALGSLYEGPGARPMVSRSPLVAGAPLPSSPPAPSSAPDSGIGGVGPRR